MLWPFLIKFLIPALVGDFNQIRSSSEKLGGALSTVSNLSDLNQCNAASRLEDLQLGGLRYTWSNSGSSSSRIECKLDKALVNGAFFHANYYKGKIAVPSPLDHSPLIFKQINMSSCRSPFRYFNL